MWVTIFRHYEDTVGNRIFTYERMFENPGFDTVPKSCRLVGMTKKQKAKRVTVRNEELHRAMMELRRGSRTDRHRDRSKYNRNDFRRNKQNGEY